MDINNKLQQAIYYSESLNWSIIPISKNKTPLIDWAKYQNKKPTKDEVVKFFSENPDANIAVVTGQISNIIVVDIDPRHGGSNEAFNRTTTLTSKTGGGGFHYFFKFEEGIQNYTGLRPGLDIKSNGGLIVLPPSVHESDKKYEWLMGPYASTPIIALPNFVKDWIKNKQSVNPAKFDQNILKGVFAGQRNVSAASMAGKLLNLFSQDEWQTGAWPMFQAWNTLNKPPMSEQELQSVFKSISSNELRSKSQSIYRNDLLTNRELEIISFDEMKKMPIPQNLWLVDKLMPKSGIICLSGRPKSGKSWLILYLAVCLASGSKFCDHFSTEKSNVLYITKDEPLSLTISRLKQMTLNLNGLSISFIESPFLFLDTDTYIDRLTSFIKEKGINVLIIDSFRRIFEGDENSSQVISKVQNQLKKLQSQGLTIIFIHHHGKESLYKKSGGDQLRGSSDILAMVDSVVILEKKDNTTLKISQTDVRNSLPLGSFIVTLPDSSLGEIGFKFTGFVDEDKAKIEEAQEDILNLLSKSNHNQTEIISVLKPSGKYGDTTIKNAIQELYETKKISLTLKGKQKIYSVTTSNNKQLNLDNKA